MVMADRYVDLSNGMVAGYVSVTPNDSTDNVGDSCIGLYIEDAGDVEVVDVRGNTNTIAVPDNFYLTGLFTRVRASNTTSTTIFALQN